MKPILVFYINTGSLNEKQINDYIDKAKNNMSFLDESVDCIFVPMTGDKTRIECVYPQFISSESKIEETKIILKNIEELFLKNLKKYNEQL